MEVFFINYKTLIQRTVRRRVKFVPSSDWRNVCGAAATGHRKAREGVNV